MVIGSDGRLTHGYGTYNHGLDLKAMTNIMVMIMTYLKIKSSSSDRWVLSQDYLKMI